MAEEDRMSRRAWVLFIALCIIWGIPYLFTRVCLREISPPTLIFLRTTLAAAVLMPLAARQGGLRRVLARGHWVAVYALCQVAGPWLLIAQAQRSISSSLAGLLVAMVPLLTVVLYRLIDYHEHLDARRLLGLAVGFGGVIALLGIDISHINAPALAEMFLATCGFTIAPLVITKRLADLPGLGVATVSLALTAIVCAPYGLTHLPGPASGQVIGAFLGLTLICTTLPLPLHFALVNEAGPARASVVTYVNPAVAILAGVIILSEPFTMGIAVGFPLVIAGSLLATGRMRETKALMVEP